MTHQEFVEKYTGKKVDWDGKFGAQCVDLIRQYWHDVWKYVQPEPTGDVGAIAFYSQHIKRPLQRQMAKLVDYDKRADPPLVPPVGSIVIFKATPSNQYGHIGICHGHYEGGIFLFDQDGFAQTGARISRWPYDRVCGWLIKNENM